MKARIKNKEECVKIFQIEIPGDSVKETTDRVYHEIKKVAKIPGFRPGFVPQDLLVKHYSKNAKEEVMRQLIPEGYRKAVEIHKVIPVGLPRIFNINFEENKPLIFEAEVDIRPNIKLKNYKGIRITKKRISVSQEEIDDTFSRLRDAYAKYNDVARPVRKGDYAICEVEAFVEGKSITKKNKNTWIMADKNSSLLSMGEELVGLTKGQEKEIETRLPEDYPDKKYAGKEAKFKILVNEVKEKNLPALDDAFAKTLNSESLEALKKEMESQLFKRKENDLRIHMKNQLLDKLLNECKFSPPSGIVSRQKEALVKRMETDLLQKGLPKGEAEKKIKELDKKLIEEARVSVQVYFLLDYIAIKEKISAGEEGISNRLNSIAASTGRPLEEVKRHYEKEGLLEGLAEQIKEDKVLEFLLQEANIVEINDRP